MTNPARVILWRHGRTQWNLELRWQGQSDIEMDEVGRGQADEAAAVLVGLAPTKIVSSPLLRAQDTAGRLASRAGLAVLLDDRLMETNGGQWEGMTQSEIRQSHSADLHRWFTDSEAKAGVTGESRVEIASRFAAAVRHHSEDGGTVVFVTHGGIVRAGLLELLDLPLDRVGVFKVLNNCGWAVLDHDEATGHFRVNDYNRTAGEPLPEHHL